MRPLVLSSAAGKSSATFRVNSWGLRYGLALLLVAACTALRWWLLGIVPFTALYILFDAAIVVAAFTGGVGPGIATTLLSAVAADVFFLKPASSLGVESTGDLLGLALFIVMGIGMSVITGLVRRRSRELAITRGHLAAAQSVAQIGSWEQDFATGLLRLSEETYRILDLPVGTPLRNCGEMITQCIHPDDLERIAGEWSASLQTGSYEAEHRVVSSSGSRWVRSRARINLDSRGKPIIATGTIQDITEQRRIEAQIEAMAFYDPLTKLPNRRLLMDRLKQMLAGCARTGRHSALFFIDLDDFKSLNDTFGHDAGDMVLQQVGGRMKDCLREQDTVARLGGDEFVVLLPELSKSLDEAAAQAALVGKKILDALERPHLFTGQPYRCTANIGVAVYCHERQSNEELLKQADTAMYRAKSNGKSRLCFFDPAVQAAVSERTERKEDPRGSID